MVVVLFRLFMRSIWGKIVYPNEESLLSTLLLVEDMLPTFTPSSVPTPEVGKQELSLVTVHRCPLTWCKIINIVFVYLKDLKIL